MRATDSLLTTTLLTLILKLPTASNGTTYGPGTSGHIIFSNGSSAYWGATTGITALGTVTTGTWNATKINPNKGGTGIDSYAKGDILYAGAAIANTATTALSKLTIGSSGQVLLTTSSGIPGWITATNANTASTIVKRDASGNFSAGTITASLSGHATSATSVTNRTSLTKGTNPSETTYFRTELVFLAGSGTADGDRLAWVGGYVDKNGLCAYEIGAYQYTAGSTTGNWLLIGMHQNGTKYYSVSDPAAFRTAISAAASDHTHSYLPLSGGVMTGNTHVRCSLTKGTNPSANSYPLATWLYQTGSGTAIKDRLAGLQGSVMTDGTTKMGIYAYRNEANGEGAGVLEVSCASNGSTKATCNGVIISSGGGEHYCMAENTTTGLKIYLDSGSGANHGLYSNGYNTGTTTSTFLSSGLFMVYRNSSNLVVINRTHAIVELQSVSYIAGAKGDAAGLLAKKTEGATAWYPAVCILTKAAGSWQIGTYTSESLEFVYAAKADITNQTNDNAKHWYLTADSYGTILTTGNYTSYTVTKTGTGASGTWDISVSGNATNAKYLMNRGDDTVTIIDDTWSHGHTPVNHTNRATVWHQRWKQSGITYTPSGGSATTLTDSGDMVLWLSSHNTANTLLLNMAIDGDFKTIGAVVASNWFRSIGSSGWYNLTNGGGWYMNDTTYLRLYGNKLVLINSSATASSTNKSSQLIVSSVGYTNNIDTTGASSVAIELWRGGNGSWQIINDGGNLHFKNNWTTAKLTTYTQNSVTIAYNTGNITTAGTLTTGGSIGINGNIAMYNTLAKGTKPANSTYRLIAFTDSNKTADSTHLLGLVYSYVDTGGLGHLRLYCYDNIASSSNAGYLGLYHTTQDTSTTVRRTETNVRIYGAVWNDYAEYRQGEIIKGGYCVHECPDGTMRKSTERLEAGCRVTSDTFGFAIGETKQCQTPIAVSGRALVYPYRDRKEYKLGDAVCSAPDGKVDIMSRNEIIMYPERIIGTVSEIPEYEYWYGGDGTQEDDQKIKVNNRIWIYVK